jgi:glycine hydroxymethyltransferase
VDIAEDLAISRAKELFGAEHVNVQPHSGSQANMAVYFTSSSRAIPCSGRTWPTADISRRAARSTSPAASTRSCPTEFTKDTERIDLDQVAGSREAAPAQARDRGRLGVSRAIDFKPFREIADEVDAAFMADIAHPAGLVAAGLHPSPLPYADFVTTTTHKTLRGPGAMHGHVPGALREGPRPDRAPRHTGWAP